MDAHEPVWSEYSNAQRVSLSGERIKMLRSWHRSDFSIDNDLYLYPSETQALENLSRYIVRCPVSLRRLQNEKNSSYVLYQPKSKK